LEGNLAEIVVSHRQIAMHFSFALGSSTTDNLGFIGHLRDNFILQNHANYYRTKNRMIEKISDAQSSE
jgi:hypothetical protein